MKNLRFKTFGAVWLLILAVPLLLAAMVVSRNSLDMQFKILLLAALLYLAVATFHHLKDKTLTFEIIIEYILIAALALIIF